MSLLDWTLIAGGITLIAMGLRHALDVDHITAIDNLIRFHNASTQSRWVGTGFSAGHMVSVLAEMIAMVYIAASVIDQGGMFSHNDWYTWSCRIRVYWHSKLCCNEKIWQNFCYHTDKQDYATH